jgi:glycosyltransferase involved in cell wall biosynthesis
MPTRGRIELARQAIAYFERQDYANCELVIVDDAAGLVADVVPRDSRIRYTRLGRELTLGAKRNVACSLARGELIANWDDDDWYAPWRLTHQMERLRSGECELTGNRDLFFYAPADARAWRYEHPRRGRPWLAGATMCFTRERWERRPFAEVDVGEDLHFTAHGTVHVDDGAPFCVAILHDDNTAAKHTDDRAWHPWSVDHVERLLGDDAPFYRSPRPKPLVSCVMPTYNRRPFVERAVAHFYEQDYPHLELIVVDDGTDPVRDLMPNDAHIRYVRIASRRSIGAKRNLACELAQGSIVVQWDDDDWYGADRVSRQVAPIVAGTTDVTGFDGMPVLDLSTGRFWRCTDAVQRDMFFHGISCGTLAYARDKWFTSGGYPNSSLGEDAVFLRRALERGARLKRLDGSGAYVYVRHGANSWKFDYDAGWIQVPRPLGFPAGALEFDQRPTGIVPAGYAG